MRLVDRFYLFLIAAYNLNQQKGRRTKKIKSEKTLEMPIKWIIL